VSPAKAGRLPKPVENYLGTDGTSAAKAASGNAASAADKAQSSPRSAAESALTVEKNQKRAEVVNYKEAREKAGKSQKGGPIKGLWNIFERLHVLRLQQVFPSRQYLEQAQIIGVRQPDGTMIPTRDIVKKGRILDLAEIDGNKVAGIDLKSKQEALNSVKGGGVRQRATKDGRRIDMTPPKGKIEVEYLEKSKFGDQLGREKKILEKAREVGGKLVIRGKDTKTGQSVTIEVEPDNYKSTATTYGVAHDN
jgi:hypothetical protein